MPDIMSGQSARASLQGCIGTSLRLQRRTMQQRSHISNLYMKSLFLSEIFSWGGANFSRAVRSRGLGVLQPPNNFENNSMMS